MSPTNHNANTPNPGTSEPKVLLEDLTVDLLWPTLLRAPAMAFSPSRWFLGTMSAFMIILVTAIYAALFSPAPSPLASPLASPDAYPGIQSIPYALTTLNPTQILFTLAAVAQFHINNIAQDPWASLVLYIPILLVMGIFGFAITRSASIEFAFGRQSDAGAALSAALRTIRQIILTTLGPLLAVAILAALVMLLGPILGLPVVNILASILYIIGLALSILIVCILTMHLLTLPLSISALAIEGTDGFDALQRAYAYLVARPVRLALYAFILIILGTAVTTIVAIIANWSIGMADTLASILTNDAGRRVLSGDPDMAATEPLAHRIITLSRSALQLIVAGYAMSLIFCSSTMAYLCIRRVCDGQDITEIWDPAN
tara:strand:- start:20694 stop:21815 length:1122 start_codon:yes stop_codon:yes gene_type:complete